MGVRSGPHGPAFTRAQFPGDSHVSTKVWAWLKRMAEAGVTGVRVLNYMSPSDIVQLWGLGYRQLNVRAMHGRGRPPDPVAQVEGSAWLIDLALKLGFRVGVTWANEPNLEFDCTPAEYTSWYLAAAKEHRRRWGARVSLDNPAIAGYAPNSWEWWDGTRPCVDASDRQAHHIYPKEKGEMVAAADGSLPAWSLPWWLGQHGKRIVLTEVGCRTGTPADARRALLPEVVAHAVACDRVDEWYLFISEAEGPEQAEHQYEDWHVDLIASAPAPREPVAPAPAPKPLPAPGLPRVKMGDLEVVDLRGRFGSAGRWEQRPESGLTAFVVHHTTGGTPMDEHSAVAFLDAIAVYHRQNRGADWPGAPGPAYWAAIDGVGGIYILNDLQDVTWSQGEPWNHHGAAVALLGTDPNEAQLAAAVALWLALEEELGRKLVLLGHCECMPGQTICPSTNWEGLKQQMLVLAAGACAATVGTPLAEKCRGPVDVVRGWAGWLDIQAAWAERIGEGARAQQMHQAASELRDAAKGIAENVGLA